MDERNPAIERFVTDALASACRLDPAAIKTATALSDLDIDSLTLVAVLSQAEARFELELTTDDIVTALGARDVGALVRILERCMACRGATPPELRE